MSTKDALKKKLDALSEEDLAKLTRMTMPRIVEGYIKHIPHPPQQIFLTLNQREVMYGGAAGGGKSDALLMAALQYVDVPGYSALLLRRTWADLMLPGAIMDRTSSWLSDTDAHPKDGGRTWVFPSGARITFGYLQYDKDKYRYQSAEFQFCVKYNTPILMADGTYKPISKIEVGDLVSTLEGSRPVTKVHNVGRKPTVKITTPHGTLIASRTHPMLTPFGWVSPQEQQSIVLNDGDKLNELYSQLSPKFVKQNEYLQSGRLLIVEHLLQSKNHTDHLVKPVLLINDQNYSEVFDGLHQEDKTLQEWSFPVMLYGLGNQLNESCCCVRGCVPTNDSYGHVIQGLKCDYQPCSCCDGEQFHVIPKVGLTSLPLQDDVEQLSSNCRNLDGQDCIRGCNHSGLLQYNHPYTNEVCQSSEVAHLCQAQVSLGDEEELFDLTVAGASHYVSWSGIIARNCGFDELTQFQEETYKYLFSRIRRPSVSCLNCKTSVKRIQGKYVHANDGVVCSMIMPDPKVIAQYQPAKDGMTLFDVPLRMRGATNPGGIGHAWVRDRFVNAETREKDAIFVPALLRDNPSIDQEEYMKSLEHLSMLDKERLLNGDWDVSVEGIMFQRFWFGHVREAPAKTKWVRYWDMAATKDGDWTVGCKLGLTPEKTWIIADIKRARLTAQNVERLVLATANEDGQSVQIRMEQEGGSSGLAMIDHYSRNVLLGYSFKGHRPTGAKEIRAQPVSISAEAGNMAILTTPNGGTPSWTGAFLDEVSMFPSKGVHDDQVDALSGAYNVLAFSARARIIV